MRGPVRAGPNNAEGEWRGRAVRRRYARTYRARVYDRNEMITPWVSFDMGSVAVVCKLADADEGSMQ